VDLNSHQMTRTGAVADSSDPVETPRLTRTEWAILEMLLQRPGQLVGSVQLLTTIWVHTAR
jgi:two-component system KDP operon response regulator KdpE